MIVVDTNVVSELLRPKPDGNVLRWANSEELIQLYTASICEAELLTGVALLPSGRRKAELEKAVTAILRRSFPDRILPFDSAAAPHYAAVIRERTRAGRPIGHADAQVAAICRLHRAKLATRDAAGFDGVGLELVDPWKPERGKV